jgi:DNA-binding CsgD family transcriptional regulator
MAGDVLGEEPRGTLPRWLGERSQGNPLYALSLLQGLLDEEADLSAPELRSLPQHLADRITGRLQGLGEPALRTLELVAVAGGRSELGSLVQLTGRPIEELALVLETLVRSRWLLEEERGSRVTFEIPHPLITEALYQTMGAARRRVLHRQVARFLAGEGALAAAAPHFARSAEAGDQEAVDALCDAVRQAEARGAYGEGLAILDALVDLLPAGDPRWHEVVQALSWRAEWVVDHRADGHAELGISAMRRMDAVLEGVDAAAARAAVKLRLASFLAWGAGQLEEAERVCEDARALFVETGSRSDALLCANELAWIRGLLRGMGVLSEEAARVAEEAETAGERFALLHALGAMAAAAGLRGDFERGEGLWLRALALATEDGKPYRGTLARLSLAVTRSVSGRVAEAIALMDAARAEPGWRESPLPEWESMIRWAAGDFPGAVAAAEEALAATSARPSRRRAIGVSFAALSAVEAGMLPQADRLLALASAAYDDRDWSCYRDVVRHARGVLNWCRGDATGALAELHRAAEHMAAMDSLTPLGFVLLEMTQVAAESRAVDVAQRSAAALADLASTVGAGLYLALASIAAAWASVASGEPDRAVVSATEARGHLEGLELPFWTARADEVLGRAHGVCDPPAAVAAYRLAAEAYERCGAVWRRGGAIDAMRALGGAGRRAAATVLGAGSLTPREREVARLACQGRTAREIAEHLSIAERTVEGHIANVYAKLGISSKLELVRREAELRL